LLFVVVVKKGFAILGETGSVFGPDQSRKMASPLWILEIAGSSVDIFSPFLMRRELQPGQELRAP
jgi:predicted dienelactone hydrolase